MKGDLVDNGEAVDAFKLHNLSGVRHGNCSRFRWSYNLEHLMAPVVIASPLSKGAMRSGPLFRHGRMVCFGWMPVGTRDGLAGTARVGIRNSTPTALTAVDSLKNRDFDAG